MPPVILKYAGRDATKPYSEIHAPSILSENLTPDKHKGTLDTNTVDEEWMKPPPDESQKVVLDHERPPLGTLINAHDFEFVASKTATKKTWAFYSSAATDLITRDANKSMFDRIWFRPRTMRDVTRVNTRSKILGNSVRFPLFVAPAAMAKLMHPDGELAMARACAAKGIMQGISNNASYSMKDICGQAPSHPFFFQLYVNKDRRKSEIQLQQCNEMPNLKAIFVTVDAAAAGKREADERVKADETVSSPMSGAKASNDKQGGGLGRVMGSFIDSALNWSDVAWLRRHTKLPLVLKGVMTAADAKMAMEHGLDGILLSNHGGRNLDMSPPSILVLLELHKQCPEIFDRMEIFVDGGVRRGTDILKCLCLGATAVGVGRTFLYSVNYGQDGVEHLIDSERAPVLLLAASCSN